MKHREDLIWMMVSDGPLARRLGDYLQDEPRGVLVGETALPERGEIGVVIADDAHLGALKAARLRAGEAMQSIFLTERTDSQVQADFVLVGLQELLVNAVEHGNLEISGAQKRDLLIAGTWREEVERRLADPAYAQRRVIVTFQRGARMIAFTIQDEGEGFDHEAFLKGPPAGAGYRGRGITLARTLSFSSLTYMGSGSVVEAVILLDRQAG